MIVTSRRPARHGTRILVQSRRGKAAKRPMRKLLKRHGRPRVIVTDNLRGYGVANNELGLNVEHRQHKGLNHRAEIDRGAREGHAAFQIEAPVATIRLGSRAGFESIHGVPMQPKRAVQTRGARPGQRGLGLGFVRPHGGVSRPIVSYAADLARLLTEQADSTS